MWLGMLGGKLGQKTKVLVTLGQTPGRQCNTCWQAGCMSTWKGVGRPILETQSHAVLERVGPASGKRTGAGNAHRKGCDEATRAMYDLACNTRSRHVCGSRKDVFAPIRMAAAGVRDAVLAKSLG